uniref:Predicted protein n=2 Tax=Hordeum vulgare subsp. vulgare TaxID=112509 RepID=F2DAG8_HORVV|nr:predicted protein [Hordeum vulgare subsp. vulgare]
MTSLHASTQGRRRPKPRSPAHMGPGLASTLAPTQRPCGPRPTFVGPPRVLTSPSPAGQDARSGPNSMIASS